MGQKTLKIKGKVGYKLVVIEKMLISEVRKAMKIINIKGKKIDGRSINYT